MAISSRLRFEVLRRDGFRCTYCGATPQESELHIDHVVPVSLGGTDIPENLTTACATCNAGKASSSPSEEIIASVNLAVAAASAAQKQAAIAAADLMDRLDEYENEVIAIWDYYIPEFRRSYTPRPDLVRVELWHSTGVPLSLVEYAVRVAVQADITWRDKARYAAAVIRNKMQEADSAANPNNQT